MTAAHPPRAGSVAPAVTRPSGRQVAQLAAAVLAVSTSAPIIAASTAPPLALAAWRCALGAAVLSVWVGLRGPGALRAAGRRELVVAALAGVLLAAHFATWIPSLRFTSVASSTALVATQPVWAALIARARGAQIDAAVWVGIAISFAGVLLLTGIDLRLDPRSIVGNGLALAGAVLAAAYVTVGERARQSLSTGVYSLTAYGAAAVVLLPVCLVAGVPLGGYSASEWASILGLTLFAQLIGHGLINLVLATTSATVTSLAILFELPGAVLLAALWLGVLPPPAVLPALVLIMAGLVVVIRTARLDAVAEDPAG